jgi:hypothetical protein
MRRTLLVIAITAASVVGASLPVADAVANGGRFEIRNATSRLADGVYFATALIDYRFSDEALEALDNGVVLTIRVRIELMRVRRFWLDGTVAELNQDYRIGYQPLSERYVVTNVNSGEQLSFATLFSALNNIGRIVDLPIIDAALLESDGRYEISMKAVLDQNTLPGPLRMLNFWGSGFRLESNRYVWNLN